MHYRHLMLFFTGKAKTTRQKLLEFGWDVLPHPPYSPDIALSDFHLFRSLQNSFDGKNFNSLVDIKNHIEKRFLPKNLRCFGRMKYSSCVKDGVRLWEQNGTYIIQ